MAEKVNPFWKGVFEFIRSRVQMGKGGVDRHSTRLELVDIVNSFINIG